MREAQLVSYFLTAPFFSVNLTAPLLGKGVNMKVVVSALCYNVTFTRFKHCFYFIEKEHTPVLSCFFAVYVVISNQKDSPFNEAIFFVCFSFS